MELGLNGKVAIVTGASRGIGRSIALGLAAEGCRLGICARGAERLEQTAGEIRALGAEVLALPVDATDGSALERFVALPPAPLEQRERLEQLRALEAGMRIDVGLVDTVPLGVDTPADLERARRLLGPA